MTSKSKRGRPRLHPDGNVRVNVRLANKSYDQLCEEARRKGTDISTEIRQAIERRQRIEPSAR